MRTRIVNRAVVSCLAAVAGSSGLGVAAASADTVLAPTNDTYVASATPAANFASATLLAVTGTPASQALLRFTAPSGAIAGSKAPPLCDRLILLCDHRARLILRMDDHHGHLEHATRARRGDRQQVVGVGWMERHRASGHGREQRRRDLPAGNEAQRCGRTVPRRAQHAPSELVLTAAPAPPAPTPPPPPATVVGATPLWNGDTFTIDPTGFNHGGAGALPSYQWSSASGPAGGYFQPHSNTDPNVHGATRVPDPAGINRTVIKLNADERKSNGAVRARRDPREGTIRAMAWIAG